MNKLYCVVLIAFAMMFLVACAGNKKQSRDMSSPSYDYAQQSTSRPSTNYSEHRREYRREYSYRFEEYEGSSRYSQGHWITVHGYEIAPYLIGKIELIAGVYVGTAAVWREHGNVLKVQGTYNERRHPQALHRVLSDLDQNNDKIITQQEFDLRYQELLAPFMPE